MTTKENETDKASETTETIRTTKANDVSEHGKFTNMTNEIT